MRYLATIIFLAGHMALAQYQSPLDRFSVDYIEGCVPFTVNVSKLAATQTVDGVQYSFEEGVGSSDSTYTYNSPGTHRIIQYVGESFSPQTDTIYLTVHESLTPEFTWYQCSETQIVVDIHDTYYDYFYLKTATTDSVLINEDRQTLVNLPTSSGSFTIKGHFTDAFPNCGEINTSVNLNTITETFPDRLELVYGCANNFYIELEATSLEPSVLYEVIYSTSNSGSNSIFMGQILNGTHNYPISLSTLQQTDSICIQLNTINPCDSTLIYSSESCQLIEDFVSLDQTYATYSGDDILINIGSIENELNLYKSLNDNYSFVGAISSNYLDPPISNFRPTNYKLTVIDSCGISVDSILVTPPFLEITDKSFDENVITLDATPPINEMSFISDSLVIYNTDSSIVVIQEYNPTTRIPSTIGETVNLRLKYTYDSTVIYSNEVEIEVEVEVFVPDAFTPNGDGLNDQLELFGLPTTNFTFLIFDRWGKVIHQTSENPVWDGRIGKKNVTEGNYLYRLSFELESGELKSQVGTFVVLKN
ncbi:MAG: hypothetical protein CMP48_18285 [Rickettsiales bacterium]|nr:hypothetical protein [Rickettsiales bacterium]